ncbi:MAG: FAD:protein FMN transferase [Planctomycetales bacterium]|nr:FAD:protein FMN transferase [Planctomycetales bacterium]MBN8628211.1 FAD:protein FMN transferase [Planctomycetota bacterium]
MEPKPPDRRRFLSGRAALEAVRQAATEAALGARGDQRESSPLEEFDRCESPYLVRYTRTAMASDFQLFLVAGVPDDAAEPALAALDQLETIEARLTIYRETSEVLEINRRAAEEPVPVADDLFALLVRAQELYRATGGAYDITSGPLSKAWGFARRQGSIPSDEALSAARTNVGGDGVLLDAATRTVRFARPGIEINLNSCGKGFALDVTGAQLRASGIEHYLWQGGNSSVLAYGSAQPGRDPKAGWVVGVGHPLRTERRLAEVLVQDGGVGTSGAGFQFFRHEGRRYGHILDPRTGRPAEGVFSVTVLAPTAAEADALSTAFYVLGYDEAAKYCAARPEIGFLMLLPSGKGSSVDLAIYGLREDQWRLVDDRSP